MSTLYDQDFYLWTQRTAELIRAGRFNELDVENTAEEIESLGRSDKHKLLSRLTLLTIALTEVAVPAGWTLRVLGGHAQGAMQGREEAAG